MSISRKFVLIVAWVVLGGLPSVVRAAGGMLVWPVDPVIEADARAAAVWLENRGTEPVLLQLRIFGWSQAEGESVYSGQKEIVGTPPMIEIAPGVRQLLRLTRVIDMPAGQERAYRVIIDEVPRPKPGVGAAGAGVRFQLRYSIPLFVHGRGLRRGEQADVPQLLWRTVLHDGRPHLEVENQGRVHARLTRAELRQDGAAVPLAEGLLGYVLPGAIQRWPLPEGAPSPAAFIAAVNGAAVSETIPAVP